MSKIDDLIQEFCPDGVEYKPIKKLAEVGTGSSNGNEAQEDGKYPFFIRSQTVKRKNEWEYDEEAIIIPGEGGIGEIYHYVNGKYAIHQRVYRIHFTDNSVDVKFAYHYFRAFFKNFIISNYSLEESSSFNQIIEKICKTYGEKIIFEGKEYYTFPTPDELSKAEVVDLRKLGLGFRDTRVYETTRKIVNKDVDLQKLHENNDTNCVREVLLTLPGVGPKVADCILLFSTLKRLEAFPIDVWVRRVINELYIKNENEEKVNKKEIEQIAKAKYGNLAGIAQQYLFYWKREA